MLWVFVVRALAWCSHILEISSIHTGEQIKNNIFLKIQAKDLVRERLRYSSQNDRLPLLSLFAFAGHYEKFSFLMYDSWSALPWKYDPAQNRISTFPKIPVVFSGLLVYLALSARFLPVLRFSREFRMWSIQYFTSLSSERQHFLFTISSSGSA